MSLRLASFVVPWLVLVVVATGCASGDGTPGRPDGSRMDSGGDPRDGGGGGDDAGGGREDGGTMPPRDGGGATDGGGGGTDSGPPPPGSAGACEACRTTADCRAAHYCAPLMSGGMACLPVCNPDLPDCPPRFDCVRSFSASIPEPVCAPVGERCCVDADGDLHGSGVGCLGTDCNDGDPVTNSSASEVCDGADNDCDGTPDDGDPNVLCPRGDHVATTSCAGGRCEIGRCEPGWADCNMSPADGCERSTGTVMDCGTCGMPCSPPNATGDCSSGACRIGSCNPGFGDCNGSVTDGCETRLDTLASCGSCGAVCDVPRASETCAGGTCRIASCDAGWGDCDGSVVNGCETSTRTNADCGACGRVCSPLNGSGDCSTGTCRLTTCSSGWGDCDFDGMSCETSLRTSTNCGMCGMACSFPGATGSCSTGSCTFGSCNTNYSNCDGTTSNGCEVNHRSVSGTCGSNNIGSFSGDLTCGFGCPSNPEEQVATRTGRTSAWYAVTMREDSDCDTNLRHRVVLESPAGVDYDLFVYRNTACGTLIGMSRAGAGATDTVTIDQVDNWGTNDTFTYYIEVRHFSGSSCTNYTLRIFGRPC